MYRFLVFWFIARVFTHRITESIFSSNVEHGISYTSTQTRNHLLRIERCKITNNGGASTGAIHLNAANQAFELFNNYLANNRNGTIYSRLHYEESESNMPKNHIHGNTFDSNRGGSLLVEGVTGPYLHVKVTNNHFSGNFAGHPDDKVNSVCRIANLRAHVQGNFFYNNVGQYAFDYSYFRGNTTAGHVLHFLNNTLYKNSAVDHGANYGATILCNGAAEIHGNVLENPGNRYQISTTLQGSQVVVNASSNWWGESVADLIDALIMDKSKDNRLSLTVMFKPFVLSPPQRVIAGNLFFICFFSNFLVKHIHCACESDFRLDALKPKLQLLHALGQSQRTLTIRQTDQNSRKSVADHDAWKKYVSRVTIGFEFASLIGHKSVANF